VIQKIKGNKGDTRGKEKEKGGNRKRSKEELQA